MGRLHAARARVGLPTLPSAGARCRRHLYLAMHSLSRESLIYYLQVHDLFLISRPLLLQLRTSRNVGFKIDVRSTLAFYQQYNCHFIYVLKIAFENSLCLKLSKNLFFILSILVVIRGFNISKKNNEKVVIFFFHVKVLNVFLSYCCDVCNLTFMQRHEIFYKR